MDSNFYLKFANNLEVLSNEYIEGAKSVFQSNPEEATRLCKLSQFAWELAVDLEEVAKRKKQKEEKEDGTL